MAKKKIKNELVEDFIDEVVEEVVEEVVDKVLPKDASPVELDKHFGVPPVPKEAAQKPSVGRMVHYEHPIFSLIAAVIAKVNENGTVNLTYFKPDGDTGGIENVPQGTEVCTWHWPARV